MPTFTPPVAAKQNPLGRGRLLRRYATDQGLSVLKAQDGTYSTVPYPSQLACIAAAVVYLGGHIYTVDSTEAAALTAAGYGAYIS